ncbi:MAG: 30S ribosome-binding factor RbfA [Chlorobi bacterium]|nr:30S ribosome-binding factor RbfA [Chlorobiota bacterium]
MGRRPETLRNKRIAETIRHEIAQLLISHLNTSEIGLVTLTDVKMSPDLKIATLYVSIFHAPNSKETSLALLEEKVTEFRREIGRRIRIKYTPEIRWKLDDSLDTIEHIDALLHPDKKRKEG